MLDRNKNSNVYTQILHNKLQTLYNSVKKVPIPARITADFKQFGMAINKLSIEAKNEEKHRPLCQIPYELTQQRDQLNAELSKARKENSDKFITDEKHLNKLRDKLTSIYNEIAILQRQTEVKEEKQLVQSSQLEQKLNDDIAQEKNDIANENWCTRNIFCCLTTSAIKQKETDINRVASARNAIINTDPEKDSAGKIAALEIQKIDVLKQINQLEDSLPKKSCEELANKLSVVSASINTIVERHYGKVSENFMSLLILCVGWYDRLRDTMRQVDLTMPAPPVTPASTKDSAKQPLLPPAPDEDKIQDLFDGPYEDVVNLIDKFWFVRADNQAEVSGTTCYTNFVNLTNEEQKQYLENVVPAEVMKVKILMPVLVRESALGR